MCVSVSVGVGGCGRECVWSGMGVSVCGCVTVAVGEWVCRGWGWGR